MTSKILPIGLLFARIHRYFYQCLLAALCTLGFPLLAFGLDNQVNDKYGLLVGVSHPPNISSLLPLKGIENDIKAMRTIALKLGIPEHNLRVLADSSDEARPTYQAILENMRWIKKNATSGSSVLVYLAGHGGQQPANLKENPSPESDDLDEIFFATDSEPWSDKLFTAPNTLTDNLMRIWLDTLQEKNVHVWLIVDMCHAGTFSRGTQTQDNKSDYEIFARRGATLADIGIDLSSKRWINQNFQTKPKTRIFSFNNSKKTTNKNDKFGRSKMVAFYASSEAGETAEVRHKNSPAKVHGLFTLFLTEEIQRMTKSALSNQISSYRLLMHRVQARYRKDLKNQFEPAFDGVDSGLWFGK